MATIRPKSHTPWASGDEMGPILTYLIRTWFPINRCHQRVVTFWLIAVEIGAMGVVSNQ